MAKHSIFFERCASQPILLLDCDFQRLHNKKNTSSLVKQIANSYSVATKNVPKPCLLVVCGLDAFTHSLLAKNAIENWLCYFTSEKLEDIVLGNIRDVNSPLLARKNLDYVYLSADSPVDLNTAIPVVAENTSNLVYIVGGLIDRNSHKNACFKKALSLSLKHARLPQEALACLTGCKVLVSFHVISILVKFINGFSLVEAVEATVPLRKQKRVN